MRERRDSQQAARFVEPDFGGREDLPLLISLYGSDFEIERRRLDLSLPRRGSSEYVQTRVMPLSAKKCKLEIVVSLAIELEVIQICEVEVEAVELLSRVSQPEPQPTVK